MGKTKRIKALIDCMVACEKCIVHCIKADNKQCISLCMDCVDVCALCMRLEARSSGFRNQIHALCAKICEACAEECTKHADKHESCKRCAEACTKCAAATCE